MANVIYDIYPGARGVAGAVMREAVRALGEERAPDYSGILYLAPSVQMVEDRRRAFLETGGDCYISPRMATLGQYVRELYEATGTRVPLPRALTAVMVANLLGSGIAYGAAVTGFLNETRGHAPASGFRGYAELYSGAIEELGLPDEVGSRVGEALGAGERYSGLLERAGLVDQPGMMLEAVEHLAYSEPPAVLVIDGFSTCTEAEWLLIEALIERSPEVVATLPAGESEENEKTISRGFAGRVRERLKGARVEQLRPDVPPELKEVVPFPTLEDEVRGIARSIKSQALSGRIRTGRLDEVIAAFPRLEKYAPAVERIFRSYGIPHTLEGAGMKSAADLPAVRDLLTLLECIEEDYPRLGFAVVLGSPAFTRIPGELRELAPGVSTSAGIVRGREQWLRAIRKISGSAERSLRRIFGHLEPLERLRGERAGYAEYSAALGEVLRALGFKMSSSEEEAEGGGGAESRSRLEMREALSWLSSLDALLPEGMGVEAGDEGVLRPGRFREALEHYFRQEPLEPPRGGGVRVMEIGDVWGLEPEVLFLGGLTDQDLPAMPEMDHLLPDRLRIKLGLRDLNYNLSYQSFIFHRVAASPEGAAAWLSYPSMEGDTEILPSLYLRGTESVSREVSGIYSAEELLLKDGAGRPLAPRLSEIGGLEAAGRSFGPERSVRVTDIDGYRRCPRRFFIERVARLRPPEFLRYELDHLVWGNVVHSVMERLIPGAPENRTLLGERAVEVLREVLEKEDLEPFWKKLISESFLECLPEILKIEDGLREAGYVFERAEHKVEGRLGNDIALKGKADRIDTRRAEEALPGQAPPAIILDYKTGSSQTLSSTGILERGEDLQPLLYAALLGLGGRPVERVGLYSLKDFKIYWIPNKTDLKKGRPISEYIEAALGYLGETIGPMRQGDFTARPLNDTATCRNCHERPYCPYIQDGGAVTREEEKEGDGTAG